METPLEGIKVLDLSRVVAGPLCTMLLGDMGADVIKIEPHRGDETRAFSLPFMENESRYFMGVNRNKRGMVLDIRQPEGKEIVYKLTAWADIFVHNFRSEVAKRLGCDYETISGINPGIIYCSNTAFGKEGPYKDKPGFDLISQAIGGLMKLRSDDSSPPQVIRHAPAADVVAATLACYGIVLALRARDETGRGQQVETSLLLSTLMLRAMYFVHTENHVEARATPNKIAVNHCYETADGYIAISAINDKQWANFCTSLEISHLLDDPRFTNLPLRVLHSDELADILTEVFQQKGTAEWIELLEARQVPCGPVISLGELFEHPQVEANDFVARLHHPLAGPYRMVNVPVRLSETPGRIERPSPSLGQHTEEVLSELGYSKTEIETLREKKVI